MKFFSFLFFLTMIPVFSFTPQPDPINIQKWSASFDVARSLLLIKVKMEIPSPWHVYSDTLEQEYFVPTGIVLADPNKGVRVKKNFPKPMVKKILGEELTLFAGNLEFSQVFHLKGKPPFPLKALLRYQSCTDQLCLPPKSIPIEIQQEKTGGITVKTPKKTGP